MTQEGAIVLARLDSRRLPGKVLLPVGGHPLLWYVIARLRTAGRIADRIILATTDRSVDDPLAAFAREAAIGLYRGACDDVAGRLLDCAEANGLDRFLRINGDSPFVDAELIEIAGSVADETGADLVTNLSPRSFPYGVSVENVSTGAYRRARAMIADGYEREHAMQVIYRNPARFSIENIACGSGEDLSDHRLTVDEPTDLESFAGFVETAGDEWTRIGFRDAVETGLFKKAQR